VIPAALALPFLAAFAVSLAATGWARRLALRSGRLDVPSARSSHARPTARTGGFAIAAGCVAGAAVARASGLPALPSGLVLGAGGFFLAGALDDLVGLRPVVKLLLQAAAASAAAAAGLRLDLAAWGAWPGFYVGPWAAPAAALWAVAVVNVVNFMDGIDGITTATTLVVLAAALGAGDGAFDAAHVAAAGAVAGFLPWNAPPARIFMGDGGSHLLGFLVASAALAGPSGGAPAWPMVVAALLPSGIDVAGALVTKRRRGVPLSEPHNDHRYQRLVKAGSGHGAVAIRYGVLAACLAWAAGPFAALAGPGAALGFVALLLVAHVAQAARATAGVPRIGRA
jgi:UDP-N-acetylmuramyl pentapeptide phosphotransferase/UDP-N-acetylglucosamine-1-phosphate transferase